MRKSWYVVVAALALVLLAVGPLAATQANFYLNSAGSGANLAGVYTSPYTGQIDGGPTIPVICDDFADDSYVPEQWTANVTQLSSLPLAQPNNLKWMGATVNGQSLNQTQAYDVAAVLAVDIILAATGSQAQEDYSFALWGLFDPSGVKPGDLGAFGQLASYGLSAANAIKYLNDAVTFVTSGTNMAQVQNDVNAVTIYSYAGGATCGGPCPTAPPQEFLTVSMAEPPAPALLGTYLLGIAGLFLFARRRLVDSVNLTRS